MSEPGKLIDFRRQAKSDPNQDLIHALEETLARVKAGEVQALIILEAVVKDGRIREGNYRMRGPWDDAGVVWFAETLKMNTLRPEQD